MRKKGEDQTFAVTTFGILGQFFNDLLVTQMNAVESSNGNDSFFVAVKFGYRLEDLQSIRFKAANLSFQFDIL